MQIAGVLDADMRRILTAPFAEGIFADALGDDEPAAHDLRLSLLHAFLLEVFRKYLRNSSSGVRRFASMDS